MRTSRWIAALCALAALSLFAPAAGAAKRSPASKATITVVSSRPDLVSGGSALVRVDLSRAGDVKRAKALLGRRAVTRAFTKTGPKQLTGLVTGLRNGKN